MKNGFIKVAAASPVIRVCDCEYNADRVIETMEKAEKLGVKVLAFPELTLTGVSCYDMIGHRVLLDGAKAALEVLSAFSGLRILVTPGMVELGAKQESLNREFGAQAAGKCDYALLVGRKQAPPIRAGLLSAGFPEEKILVCDTIREAVAAADALEPGRERVILLENDLPDNY